MSLFTSERYSYWVLATNVIAPIMTDMTHEMVWEFYNGRVVVENRIEEVKNRFKLSKILSSDYMSSASHFQMVMPVNDLIN